MRMRTGGLGAALLAAVLLCATALVPTALEAQLIEDELGFVDFERFGSYDYDDLKVEINLGGALLKVLSGAVEDDDGEFAQLLRSLKLIKVNVFEVGADQGMAAERMNDTVLDLRRRGWESVVRIRDDEEIHILVRSDDELILGLLAAWASPGGDVGLVNIVGDFDPAQIARLARQLDIGPLKDVDFDALDPDGRR